MKNIIIFFISNIAKVIGTFFGKRFALLFASICTKILNFFGFKNLLTFLKFKRYIDVIASILYFFANRILFITIFLRKLVKNDITLLTGILSVARYFKDKLPFKFVMVFIIKLLEILTLVALFSVIFNFEEYTIKSGLDILEQTYSDLKEYFDKVIKQINEFVLVT
jgi:hypothetical protein